MNLEEMKKELEQLKKKSKTQNPIVFKPIEGDQVIRIIPLKGNPDNPFQKLQVHYKRNKTFLSPETWGEVDPFVEFSNNLIADSNGKMSKEDFKYAKSFCPALRTYAYIIVRGKEQEGIKIWGFGRSTYEKLLNIVSDTDYGSIDDIVKGHDLKLHFTPDKKSDTGFAKTEITPRPMKVPLTDDAQLLDQLLNQQPDLVSSLAIDKLEIKEMMDILSQVVNSGKPTSFQSQGATIISNNPNVTMSSNSTTTQWAQPTTTNTPKPTIPKDITDQFEKMFNNS